MSSKKAVSFREARSKERRARPLSLSGGVQELQRHRSKSPVAAPSSPVNASAMSSLLECPMCGDRLANPKMLPCQHTFCAVCLSAKVVAVKDKKLRCPTCNISVTVENVESLPNNLYIVSMLKLVESSGADARDVTRCVQCGIAAESAVTCPHCQQPLCGVCWPKHVSWLEQQLTEMATQLQGAMRTLTLRAEEFKERCDGVKQRVEQSVEERVQQLRERRQELFAQTDAMLLQGSDAATALLDRLEATRAHAPLAFRPLTDNHQKVLEFLRVHKRTASLLAEVGSFGEARPVFDDRTLRLDTRLPGDAVGKEDASNGDVPSRREAPNLDASPDAVSLFYRSLSWNPRLVIRRSAMQRPSGLALCPWSEVLFVAASDANQLLVLDRTKGRILRRISHEGMLCPHTVACCPVSKLIIITDKWSHCVHVLDAAEGYVRTVGRKGRQAGELLSPEGLAVGPCPRAPRTLLYICDTGNDRLQVLTVDGEFLQVIGGPKEFNQPTGVALGDDRIVVADCGNTRIKVFSLSGEKLQEFGCPGANKGQFRSPECVAMDAHGFFLVGDSGNARLQIFRPNGHLVRVVEGCFGWISSITVTPHMDIWVTDFKNHSVINF